MFGTFVGCISGYRFYTISESTKRYHVDESRGYYRYHPIPFRPLSSTIDYLSIETFQFHVESTVRDYRKEVLFTIFCYFAPVTRHRVQTMCTMFSRKDFFRLFDGLPGFFTRKTNAEPRRLTSVGGHDGAICAAKHLELVHAYHLANPYTDLTNSIWGTKYQSNLYVMSLSKLTRKCTVTHDGVKSYLFHRVSSCSVK